MDTKFKQLLQGYEKFKQKYAQGEESVMQALASQGQQPETMVVACCDSRVDPALLFQCRPGDLFVVRNVANIIPPYEKNLGHHGVSAALEFGINVLSVKHLIILGHSQCGGIQARMQMGDKVYDFLDNWLSLLSACSFKSEYVDECAQLALQQSYKNCMQFPWIKEKVDSGTLSIYLWFFDIKSGQIFQQDKAV